jgi:hypothetical protein
MPDAAREVGVGIQGVGGENTLLPGLQQPDRPDPCLGTGLAYGTYCAADPKWTGRAIRYCPDPELPNVWAVDGCESGHGTDPGTYDLTAENGGRLQLNRATWEPFFLETEGWTWDQIVLDDEVNLHAASIIWERSGQTWDQWSCKP